MGITFLSTFHCYPTESGLCSLQLCSLSFQYGGLLIHIIVDRVTFLTHPPNERKLTRKPVAQCGTTMRQNTSFNRESIANRCICWTRPCPLAVEGAPANNDDFVIWEWELQPWLITGKLRTAGEGRFIPNLWRACDVDMSIWYTSTSVYICIWTKMQWHVSNYRGCGELIFTIM